VCALQRCSDAAVQRSSSCLQISDPLSTRRPKSIKCKRGSKCWMSRKQDCLLDLASSGQLCLPRWQRNEMSELSLLAMKAHAAFRKAPLNFGTVQLATSICRNQVVVTNHTPGRVRCNRQRRKLEAKTNDCKRASAPQTQWVGPQLTIDY
jgi:hypothetical protein